VLVPFDPAATGKRLIDVNYIDRLTTITLTGALTHQKSYYCEIVASFKILPVADAF
jgi:hypothetical protein